MSVLCPLHCRWDGGTETGNFREPGCNTCNSTSENFITARLWFMRRAIAALFVVGCTLAAGHSYGNCQCTCCSVKDDKGGDCVPSLQGLNVLNMELFVPMLVFAVLADQEAPLGDYAWLATAALC